MHTGLIASGTAAAALTPSLSNYLYIYTALSSHTKRAGEVSGSREKQSGY